MIIYNRIPEELKNRKQWVLWKLVIKDRKKTKVPYQINGQRAKCNDPKTWSSFDTVYSLYKSQNGYAGIGYVFIVDDPFIFIDFDHCIKNGVIDPAVTKWIEKFASYTEKSQSGRGIHIIIIGDIPSWSGNRKGNIEIYSHNRFAVMTGDVIGEYDQIRPCQDVLEELCSELFPNKHTETKPSQEHSETTLSDHEIIIRAMSAVNGEKFRSLFAGDTSGYPSKSEADMALASLLSFYTQDGGQIERIMNMSALRREKWNRRDYMERTIGRAITERTEVYDPKKNTIDDLVEKNKVFLRYFENGTFIPKLLADELMSEYPFICVDGLLYVYVEGVWRAIGDDFIAQKATEKLQNQTRTHRVNEVIAYIRAITRTENVNLNRHTELINLKNGMLNWRTGELLEHDPDYYSTIQIPVVYDPNADASEIANWLESTLGDAELIQLALELFGYCLIPDTTMCKAFMLTGAGANGKSTFISVLEHFIGKDNVSKIPLQELAEHRFKRADLFGKLVNVFADLDNKSLESTTYFKTIVSGDSIDAERKNRDPFYFKPFARLVFSANEIPRAKDKSYAYYRRWCIIPFENRFEGERANKELLRQLLTQENLSALLNQALNGLRRVMKQGFTKADKVTRALAEYERQNDPVKAFIDDMVEFDPQSEIDRKELYDAFCRFCDDEGYKETTRNYFYQRVRAIREVKERKTPQYRFFVGIKYKSL